jgi:hypothetical protein
MDATHIKTKFEKLGARAKIGQLRRLPANPLVIDIGHDRHGEFFDIQADQAPMSRCWTCSPGTATCS